MQIGEFIFDLPVWLIRADAIGGKDRFAICQIEVQDCLSVFTDEDLAEKYIKLYLTIGVLDKVIADSAKNLEMLLKYSLRRNLATHVAFDPLPTAFVCPIVALINLLKGESWALVI